MLIGLPSISYMLEILSHISLPLPWYFSSWSFVLLCCFVMVLILWIIWMMPNIHLTYIWLLLVHSIFRTLIQTRVAFLISTAEWQSQSHLCHIPIVQWEFSSDNSRGQMILLGGNSSSRNWFPCKLEEIELLTEHNSMSLRRKFISFPNNGSERKKSRL